MLLVYAAVLVSFVVVPILSEIKKRSDREAARVLQELESRRRLARILQLEIESLYQLSNSLLPGSPLNDTVQRIQDLESYSRRELANDAASRSRVLSCSAYGYATCLQIDQASKALAEAEGIIGQSADVSEERASLQSTRSVLLALECRCDAALSYSEKATELVTQVQDSEIRRQLSRRVALARALALWISGAFENNPEKMTLLTSSLEVLAALLGGLLYCQNQDQKVVSGFFGKTSHAGRINIANAANIASLGLDLRITSIAIEVYTAEGMRQRCDYRSQKSIDAVCDQHEKVLAKLPNPLTSDGALLYPFLALDYGGFLTDPRVARDSRAIEVGEIVAAYLRQRSSRHPFLITINAKLAASAFRLWLKSHDENRRQDALRYARVAMELNVNKLADEMPARLKYSASGPEYELEAILRSSFLSSVSSSGFLRKSDYVHDCRRLSWKRVQAKRRAETAMRILAVLPRDQSLPARASAPRRNARTEILSPGERKGDAALFEKRLRPLLLDPSSRPRSVLCRLGAYSGL